MAIKTIAAAPVAAWTLLVLFALPVAAESKTAAAVPAAEERPWAKGVDPEKQKSALALFAEGNALLNESVFAKSAEKYREALGHWDHPAIHFNLVLVLQSLQQPLEAHEHLTQALRYGAGPLGAVNYDRALNYKAVLERQLSRVDISCEVPGASVVMDGRPLFTAPGRFQGLVRSGPHTVVATKQGYLTNQLSRSLPAGETTVIALTLFTAEDLTEYRRRWSGWIPWAVVGAGAAAAGGGAFMHYTARQDFRAFDQGIESCGGCVPDDGLTKSRNRGQTLQTAAIGAYVGGGAALIGGAALVYMNRLLPYQVKPGEKPGESAVLLTPLLPFAGGASGLSASIRF